MAKWGVDADAGAAMTRDLEPYSVAYGNKPARSRAAEKRGGPNSSSASPILGEY